MNAGFVVTIGILTTLGILSVAALIIFLTHKRLRHPDSPDRKTSQTSTGQLLSTCHDSRDRGNGDHSRGDFCGQHARSGLVIRQAKDSESSFVHQLGKYYKNVKEVIIFC